MLLPQAFEGACVELPPGRAGIRARDLLLRATADMPFEVLKPTRRGLSAARAVGLIDAGPYQLEILPKTAAGVDSVQNARRLLVGLLASSTRFARYIDRPGSIASDRLPVTEAVIRSAVGEIARLLEAGAPRRYYEVTEDSPTLRGRVDFTRLARRVGANDHLIPCRWAPLNRDNPLSRLVLAVLLELQTLSKSAETLADIRQCIAAMPTVDRVPLTGHLVDEATPSALEGAWTPVVALGDLLVRGRSPIPTNVGATKGRTFVFELDRLFETLLRHRIPVALRRVGAPLSLASSSAHPLLEDLETGEFRVRLRPDFLFESAGAVVMVGDAKWKRLEPAARTLGLGRNDIYQLTAYVARYVVTRSVLMFPATNELSGGWLRRHRFTARLGTSPAPTLVLLAVDVQGLVSHRRNERAAALDALGASLLRAASNVRTGEPRVTHGDPISA